MNDTDRDDGDRGRRADKPRHIPARGWMDIGRRVKDQIKDDHAQIVAAGIAFYFFLALFPAMAAALSIYGLVMEPAQVQQQMSQLASVLPQQVHQMLADVLNGLSSKSGGSLGWSLVISVLISLWSANKGTKAIFEGVNVAYDEIDERNFFRKNAVTLLFTLGGIVLVFLCLMLIVGFPAVINQLGLPPVLQTLIQLISWAVLAVLIVYALGMIYKKGPDRDDPEFKWVSVGSVTAAALWLAGSLLFTWYVNNFGSFDKTYGSFAAIIILMLWFFLTGFVIMLGAEINSEMEHQTGSDTTVGRDRPMGSRGAYHADHVAS